MRLRDEFQGSDIAVALFDILGFRELINRTPLAEVRRIVQSTIAAAAKSRVSPDMLGSMVLSDTIILYADPKLPKQGAAALVTISSSNLINHFARRGIPLRGALSMGELWVDPRSNTMAGRALVKAYELEQQQDWCGALVDPDCADVYERGVSKSPMHLELVSYCAPLKSGERKALPCVNWVHRYRHFGTSVGALFGGKAEIDHSVHRKYTNTQLFVDHCISTGACYDPERGITSGCS